MIICKTCGNEIILAKDYVRKGLCRLCYNAYQNAYQYEYYRSHPLSNKHVREFKEALNGNDR